MAKNCLVISFCITLTIFFPAYGENYAGKLEDLYEKSFTLAASSTKLLEQSNGKVSDQQLIEKAKNSVRNELKDPYSAQFSGIKVKRNEQGGFVCGMVNAKNSFGGYVGNELFMAGAVMAVLPKEGSENEFAHVYSRWCK